MFLLMLWTLASWIRQAESYNPPDIVVESQRPWTNDER